MPTIVGTPIPEHLAQRTRDTAARLRAGEKVASEDIIDVVLELTSVSMDHQFVNTAKILGAGPVIMKFLQASTNGSLKAIRMGLNKVVPKLNDKQRRKMADFFDDALYRDLSH